ncbi:MAG: phosphotransferase [Gammaproteobacteria bacterium]|nr:phosphotransferase [Gammaproteobacteria bacterium]NNC96887.1 phosphotransferase [Gammaproteobacteria bacterium]NNM14001.1 phosphotransferase [Gammaproteobacteria bacterium]
MGWLGELGYADFTLRPASADASFRRYFRLTLESGKNMIVMDAPPNKEPLSPFIDIASDWARGKIGVPDLYKVSESNGFILMQDLGSETFLDNLNAANRTDLYKLAIDELLKIQAYQAQFSLPEYSETLLNTEMHLFTDWFLAKHCQKKPLKDRLNYLHSLFAKLRKNALAQKHLLVHRDYHSRNLMMNAGQLGVIDFQDAVIGPVSYDLVSLLKDCYIKLEPEFRKELLAYYWEKANQRGILKGQTIQQFTYELDLMGVQRHLKAIGIFCRLNYRDGKAQYLHDIPRTASYIVDLKKLYPELHELSEILLENIPELTSGVALQ